jgi:pimeloyl-ACP methyl ester carboxylesterase
VINTVTGRIASNSAFSSVYGSVEVLQEHVYGERGRYTEQIYNEVAADLRDNPLAPGQSVILMGHSGGGAVTANLSGMLERNLGVDVSGMVTMGSPVSNYDEAGRYAEVIADVRHSKDPVVNYVPIIRSEESRIAIPSDPLAALSNERSYQHAGATPNVSPITLNGPTSDPHGSYMHDPNVSVDMLRKLKTRFPNMDLQLPDPV